MFLCLPLAAFTKFCVGETIFPNVSTLYLIWNYRKSVRSPVLNLGYHLAALCLWRCWTADTRTGRLIQGKSWNSRRRIGQFFAHHQVGRSDTLLSSVLSQLDFPKEKDHSSTSMKWRTLHCLAQISLDQKTCFLSSIMKSASRFVKRDLGLFVTFLTSQLLLNLEILSAS